jgi:hypothetical protein
MGHVGVLVSTIIAMSIGLSDMAAGACFEAGTALPRRSEVLAAPILGASARDLAEALFDGDRARANRLIDADPALARLAIGPIHDMLALAVASCDPALVSALLAHGAPPDGVQRQGMPLDLALRAADPEMAYRLLKAGADASPAGRPTGPLRTAIERNSPGAVRMLIDFRADVNAAERNGRRPLHIALDMERFRIAEILLDRGADPWAVDFSGANLGSAVVAPMVHASPEEEAARGRLRLRLRQIGWPEPVPDSAEVREKVAAGRWPPARH